MRFIHIADVHLDSPFASRSEAVRDRLRRAAFEALSRCVDAAIAEEADAVLIAGDLLDGAALSFATERFLLEQMRRLADHGIQVVYAAGNHDPGHGTRAAKLDWPPNVTLIAAAEPVAVTVTRRGEPVGHVVGAGHATPRETADLSLRLRPVPDSDLPQAALLHTMVSGGASGPDPASAAPPDSPPPPRPSAPYAPSSLANLRAAGFHYWALGHVHRPQELSSDPPVRYCGSLTGRGPAETGARGGLLVDLADPAEPRIAFREFSPVRWERLRASTDGSETTLDEIAEAVLRAWDAARAADPGADDTEWMLAADVAGPSPLWRRLRDPAELATLGDAIGERIRAGGARVALAEVRGGGARPPIRPGDHLDRRDVLGASLRLARDAAAGADTLGLDPDAPELAGFDQGRHGTLADYLRRLLRGGAEEIADAMLERGDAAR